MMWCALVIISFAAVALAQQPCGYTPILPDMGQPFKGDQLNPIGKIVGGRPAISGSWPWQVSIRVGNKEHICGGSIICRNIILTAAHCVHDDINFPQILQIHVGRYYSNQETPGITRHNVTRIISHERWNQYTIDNDIAVVQIHPPIEYSDIAQPICLPFRDARVGEMALVTGWGQIDGSISGPSYELKQTFVPVITNEECLRISHIVTPNMLCTAYPGGGHGICFGDSGGPLIVREAGRWYQVGIVSWTTGSCRHPRTLSAFARVRNYMGTGWIVDKINQLGGCQ